MATTIETIHDLETQVDELKTRAISLQASLDAATAELVREQDANDQLARERDYFKSFGVEIATRLNVVSEGIAAVCKAAELAGYRPTVIPSYKDASVEQVDAALAEMGRKFGANGGGSEGGKVDAVPEKV
jgi:hypothetical protein